MNNFHNAQKTSVNVHQDEYYCISGDEDYRDSANNPRINDENDEKIVARKIYRSDGSVRYSIKCDNGKFINPISIYGSKQPSTFLDKICKSNNKFKDVNYKVFDMYVKFLRTKNTAWLNNAEREAI